MHWRKLIEYDAKKEETATNRRLFMGEALPMLEGHAQHKLQVTRTGT